MRISFKPLFSLLAYCLYGVAAVLLFLSLLFPEDTARRFVVDQVERLHPNLSASLGGAALGLSGPRLSGLVLTLRDQKKSALLRIDRLTILPLPLRSILARKPVFAIKAELAKGRVLGVVEVDHRSLALSGDYEISKIQVGDMADLLLLLNRSVGGALEGRLSHRGSLANLFASGMEADLRISDGNVVLQQAVLGMEELPFSRLALKLALDQGKVLLKNGELESRRLRATFNGTVTPGMDPLLSRLEIGGRLEPQPELFASLGEAVNLVRQQLKDGGLPFTVNGTLKEPGIVIPGLEQLP